jgi:hypothetical protein
MTKKNILISDKRQEQLLNRIVHGLNRPFPSGRSAKFPPTRSNRKKEAYDKIAPLIQDMEGNPHLQTISFNAKSMQPQKKAPR